MLAPPERVLPRPPDPLVFSDLPSRVHRAPGPGPTRELAQSKGQTAKHAGLNGASGRCQEEAGGLPGGGDPWAKAWWRSRVAPRLAVGVLGRTVTLPPALYSLRSRHRPLWLHALFPECVVRVLATLGDMARWATLDLGPLHGARWTVVTCSARRHRHLHRCHVSSHQSPVQWTQ